MKRSKSMPPESSVSVFINSIKFPCPPWRSGVSNEISPKIIVAYSDIFDQVKINMIFLQTFKHEREK